MQENSFRNIWRFNRRTFWIWSFVFIILLIPSFVAAWAEDDGALGTLGTSIIWTIFAKMFNVFRFPTHILFWSIIEKFGIFYSFGLILNCLFYGFVTERLIFIVRKLWQNCIARDKNEES